MLALIIILVIVCFSFVVFVGPPYLPTLAPQVKTALDLLDLKPGQRMLELGCGDGKVLVAAAKRGWKVTGIELNPLLVVVCTIRTWRYRRLVTVRWGNYWNTGLWDNADGIFGFVLPKYMTKLDRLIIQWQTKPVRLASFAFQIPHKKIAVERASVFLYRYPK
jgi:SAM-dependent methyltransferase